MSNLPVPPKGAPPASLPAKVQSVPPNQTLYVRGVPSAKIQKGDLRTALYMLFSTYGPVLDVVALKTAKMRGQAHIVYRDTQTATQAMRALDGSQFLGKEIKVAYAKSKSVVVSKLDGTFRMPTVSTAANVEITDLQQSIFNAPVPGSAATPATSTTAALPTKSVSAGDQAMKEADTTESRGQKRPREEEEEEEEDEDSDVAMEEDSDDD